MQNVQRITVSIPTLVNFKQPTTQATISHPLTIHLNQPTTQPNHLPTNLSSTHPTIHPPFLHPPTHQPTTHPTNQPVRPNTSIFIPNTRQHSGHFSCPSALRFIYTFFLPPTPFWLSIARNQPMFLPDTCYGTRSILPSASASVTLTGIHGQSDLRDSRFL